MISCYSQGQIQRELLGGEGTISTMVKLRVAKEEGDDEEDSSRACDWRRHEPPEFPHHSWIRP